VLKTKCVLAPAAPADGLRVLATRFRGRGLAAARYHVWVAALAPSERLLRLRQRGKISWAQFRRAYRAELFLPAGVDARNRTIKNHGQKFLLRLLKHLARTGNVTLLCHCAAEEAHCHRHLLRSIILSRRV
jgi:uncharacterized protein YeaO (DUF488 family)